MPISRVPYIIISQQATPVARVLDKPHTGRFHLAYSAGAELETYPVCANVGPHNIENHAILHEQSSKHIQKQNW